MKCLSSKELKEILISSNEKNKICKEKNKNVESIHKDYLNNIIEEKKKKSIFLKSFLRKVF